MQSRQRVRERTPEREQRVQDHEWDEVRGRERSRRTKLLEERPRVVTFDSVPWEQSRSAYHKVFTTYDTATAERKPWTAPMGTLRVMMQTIPTGHKNANHRHIAEVPFYIHAGKGHEVHDGRRHDWEAGDLMIVPPWCMHQHFCDEGPALLVYCQAGHGPFMAAGFSSEQAEMHESWTMPEDARPLYGPDGDMVGYRRGDVEFIFRSATAERQALANRTFEAPPVPSHSVTDGYEWFIRRFQEECYWRQNVPQVIQQRQRTWENTRNGRVLWFLHPMHPELQTGMKLFECYLQEIPPGGRSGKHRHLGDEAHFVIAGHGYEEIDGQRWEWSENDVVAIPNLAVHQSFNADRERPARILVYKSRSFEYASFAGIEHFEDASDSSQD
ncbi:MAG TPA: cupin domain-containing protein [Chloroflexota bacterium]|nr:cupin domain-containing protein [Chloroflexota bacterium]